MVFVFSDFEAMEYIAAPVPDNHVYMELDDVCFQTVAWAKLSVCLGRVGW